MVSKLEPVSTPPPRPAEPTFVDLLNRRAAEFPDRAIYYFLDDGAVTDRSAADATCLTYSQLDRQARAIAVTLQNRVRSGDRVLLLFAPGPEFMPAFYGCLYAGAIPVPAYPPYHGLQADPLATLRSIARDCTPSAVITGGLIAETAQQICSSDPLLSSVPWLTTEDIGSEVCAEWQRPDIDGRSIALLQYTSGSTGTPRGVLVTHANILSNEYTLQLALNHMTHVRPGVGVCWLPFHHDMGLIGNVLQSVFVDGPCYFLSPLQFLRRPVCWLEAITQLAEHTPYISGGPNFAWDLCARKVTDEQKKSLDLSHWEVAFVGAEPVLPETLRRFAEAFEPCGFNPDTFFPCYGMAEATLFVTGGQHDRPPVIGRFRQTDDRMVPVDATEEGPGIRSLVGCGHAWLDDEVRIADPVTLRECESNQVGEIFVHGPSVAAGYWNRPTETERTFHAHLDDDPRSFLRTGDLGFFHDGELFVSGRLKDLIIIRGRNVFPQDIESAVCDLHPGFRPGTTAAIGISRDGAERLVILQEIDRRSRRLDIKKTAAQMRQRIAEEFQLELFDVRFLRNGTLPKTTSGKIKRYACREMYEQNTLADWTGKAP